jgi:ABC-2 type transport system ATP-binding protein
MISEIHVNGNQVATRKSVATTPILEVKNLVKQYGKFTAVNGLSFNVEPGEIFGFLGPNGAGKTTAISVISGLFPPSAGRVSIDGYDLVKQTKEAKQLIGVVPQELAIYPTLSAYENLAFFGKIYGLKGDVLKKQIHSALEIVALTERAHEPVKNFSGGMKRRVNIAAGLLHSPRLLILDEPTVGVDPQSRNFIFESIKHLNREFNMTVIYTTHYMEEVETLCQRIAIMDSGKLLEVDSKLNLITKHGGGVLDLRLSYLTPLLLTKLSLLPGLTYINPTDMQSQWLRCQVINAEKILVEIVAILNGLNIQLLDLRITEPSLENVFLNLTGKKLRD